MPTQPVVEHPVHPVLNEYPSVLVPTSVAFDMLHLVTRHPAFKSASFLTLLGAFATGATAAVAGMRDYEAIPAGTEEKRVANAHALLSVGVLGAVAIQLLIRVTGRVGLFARLLNVAAGAGLVASSWYGTQMVYRQPSAAGGGPALPIDPVSAAFDRYVRVVPDTDLSGVVRRAADAASNADEPDFDDQGALSGSIPDGEPANVTASIRSSLDEVTSNGR